MQVYLVGGAVRDTLLGLEPKDRDYVVVGSSDAEMISLGYEQVGNGFPVFLHPETREEYALARREIKTGPGYNGFTTYAMPDVTLEQDLERRDLTINSMAMAEGNKIVDPFGGQQDLRDKVLRHTSVAFIEDPLRVVRLARFYARYADFTVAPETMMLASNMVRAGMLDELPDERFWLELEKAFKAPNVDRFFKLLYEVGALHQVRFFQRFFTTAQMSSHVLADRLKLAVAAQRATSDEKLAVDIFLAWVGDSRLLVDRAALERRPRLRSLLELLNLKIRIGSRMSDLTNIALTQELLTKGGAWRGDSTRFDELVLAIQVLEAAYHTVLAPTAQQLRMLADDGRKVRADQFSSLSGRALGQAIHDERARRAVQLLTT